MKKASALCLGLILLSFNLLASDRLLGRWLYTGFVYEGQMYPPLDPDLNLYFDFYVDGVSTLHWTWKNSASFCSRQALYVRGENFIEQWVVWVNPQNSARCQSDPDMKINSRSQTKYFIKEDQLYLELSLDNKPLYYMLTKQQPFRKTEDNHVINDHLN